MLSEPIYKVFVSSTFQDLREERAEVQKALLKLNCLPVGMELFPAADDDTWDFIKEQINDSDYYVVLVAGRYGSLAPDGVGFTEKEYDYAKEQGIPSIGFVHSDRKTIPSGSVDTDPTLVSKLDSFIEKIRKRPVRFFASPHQLASEVTTSFVDLKRTKPRVGFIRTNQTVDFQKYSELLEENSDLKQQLQKLSLSSSHELADWFSEDTTLEVSSGTGYPEKFNSVVVSWGDIALLVAPEVVADRDENDLFQELAFALLRRNIDSKISSKYSCKVADESKSTVRMKFVTKGLITVSTEQRVTYDPPNFNAHRPYNARVWKLTELGRAQLSLLSSSPLGRQGS